MRKIFVRQGRYAAVDTPLLMDAGNQACVHAIHKIARGARELASPFVIVGPPDSGKSRLLAEAGNLVTAKGGVAVGGCARDFTFRLRDALRAKAMPELVALLRDADLLLIDEFHRLSTAPRTRQFLVSRIAERIQNRVPTVIASRHAPRDIRGISDRDASQLLGGFLLHLSRPGPAVRRRYLTLLSKGAISPVQIERICHASNGGLRALRADWLQGSGRDRNGAAPRADAAALLAAVARAFDVAAAEVAGRKKNPSLLRAREAFVELAPRLGVSRIDMRKVLDDRESLAITRIHARARRRVKEDPHFSQCLERVLSTLGFQPAVGPLSSANSTEIP